MKFYILKHPYYGYFCGTKIHKYYNGDISKSRKFNQRNFASSCKTQTQYLDTESCEIICIEFKEFTETPC